METIANVLLVLHIIAGSVALICGLLAIISAKGGILHRRSGRVFFWSMVAVAFSALGIASIHANVFLFRIGLFSLYMVHGGSRAIHNKALIAAPQDRAMLLVGGLNAIWMLSSLNVVLMTFGAIGLFLSLSDLRSFILTARGGKVDPKAWLRRHIGMMMGTYIATTTAFLLTALKSLDPGILVWLAPTILGVPFIIVSSRRRAPRISRA